MAEKVAIVAGGSAGVGYAVVEALLKRKYRVGVIARGQGRLDEIAARHGDRVAVASADVANAEAFEAAADGLIETLGTPTVWVNSAMLTSFSPFTEVGPAEFDRIVDVTFKGQVNGTRIALRRMERGNVVCVGSGLGYRSVPFQAAYCAAKHAINGFVGAVRSELLRAGRPLELSLVQLPAMNTPQFEWAKNRLDMAPQPAPPIYAPELGAAGVMKAIDGDLREVFVGKSVVQLTIGQAVLPGYLDRMLSEDGAEQQKSDKPAEETPDNLYEPVEYPAQATGRFGDRASEDGPVLDAATVRRLIFFGGPIALFVLGVILGAILVAVLTA